MAKIPIYIHYPAPNNYFTGKDVPKGEIILKKNIRYGYFTTFAQIDKKVNDLMNRDRPHKFIYASKYYKNSTFKLEELGNVAKWVKSTQATALHFRVGQLIHQRFFPHAIEVYLNNSLPAMLKLPRPLFKPYIPD